MAKKDKNPKFRPSNISGESRTAPKEIVLIHLSDLHIGDTNRFPIESSVQCKTLGVRFGRAIKGAANELAVDLDAAIVVVSGDLTNTGQADEFAKTVEFLQGLGGEVGIGNHHFVICPGNHDIDWFECEIAEIEGRKKKISKEESRKEIDRRKFDNYRQFLSLFYGDVFSEIVRPIIREAHRRDFSHLRVSVMALNACERESHQKEDHIGAVSSEQAQAAYDSWHHDDKKGWIRILCVHHNPDLTAPDNLAAIRNELEKRPALDAGARERIIADIGGFVGKEGVRRIAEDARVSVLLHGHQHESDVRSWKWNTEGETLILAAGSAGVNVAHLPGDQPNQVRVIAINPSAGSIRVRTLVWDPRARQAGSVEAGNFVFGSGERDRYDGPVYIPEKYKAPRSVARSADLPETDSLMHGFLATYRQRLSHTWADWDLKGMAAVGGLGRQVTAGLDDMYQPLRLAPPNLSTTLGIEAGSLLEAVQLTKAKRPLLIRGPAGVGKTTWMRYTFRRLLADPTAVPFMLVLRDVAARWSQPERDGQSRSLDACIRDSVAERMGEGWNPEVFLRALTALSGPVPVLMIDGWDELGDHGKKLREMLLGFMQQHRRVRVVVSSRPWGDGVPDQTQGFDVLEVQPLSDSEVESFSRRFFRICYSLDDAAVDVQAKRFLLRLKDSSEAKALTRTALFLTMMLVVSRHKPLPDKRHQLYRECLSTLLKDRPDTWQREGVQRNRDWWRPDDAEQRWKAVARLAAELQAKGYKGPRKAVVARDADIVAALPSSWTITNRSGFLWWLIGEAALIMDRADGTYTFAHLSFQEYLTAWHLHASVSDGEWARPVLERIGSHSWWETLLLYAAEVGSTSDERVDVILNSLIGYGVKGLAVAGMILADGGGSDVNTEVWSEAWIRAQEWGPRPSGWERCAVAWGNSQQEARREVLGAALMSVPAQMRWWQWERLQRFARQAGFEIARPHQPLALAALECMTGQDRTKPQSFALGRVLRKSTVLNLADPSWLLLHWPSRRRRLAASLQSAILAGAPQSDLLELTARELSIPEVRSFPLRGSKFAHDAFLGMVERHFKRASAIYGLKEYVFNEGFSPELQFLWDHTGDQVLFESYDLLNQQAYDELYGSLAATSEIAAPWLFDHIRNEILTFDNPSSLPPGSGRSAHNTPEAGLIAWAEGPEKNKRKRFPVRLAGQVHTLWAALARHLAGLSSTEDRSLLVELASQPERVSSPLSSALQYIVRGDLLLEDGSTVALDTFLPAGLVLPMLEEP